MSFVSFEFGLLLCITLALLLLVRVHRMQVVILLVASYCFYAYWDYRFTLLLIFSTLVDFQIGKALSATTGKQLQRRVLLTLSIATNLGVLGFFKYYNFFVDSINFVIARWGWNIAHLDIILPIGISFYTFQTMSYTIDVYRGKMPATRSLINFAAFVAFFPQLVAGPIVRAADFIPQIERRISIQSQDFFIGLQIFLQGLFKKLVIADNLSIMVDQVYAAPHLYSSRTVWLAVFAYSIQILCDFSGYSDMAIGTARMLGFRLPQNFNMPYISQSFSEFWRRWHISLSSWLRDYLYISLGGNRKGEFRTYVNLMITMLLGGLWHGASWNFVIWGALHGAYLAVERRFGWEKPGASGKKSATGWARMLSVFLIVTLTWVFFRSPSMSVTTTIFEKLFYVTPQGVEWFSWPVFLVVFAFVVGGYVAQRWKFTVPILSIRHSYTPAWLLLQVLMIYFWAPTNVSPFIYFQF